MNLEMWKNRNMVMTSIKSMNCNNNIEKKNQYF